MDASAVADFPAAADSPIERRIFRKIAWRMLPVLAMAYVFNSLDRVNVGFAAITMNADIGLSATTFGYGSGMLFIGYCLFEVPSNLMLFRFGSRVWLSRIMISWGLISAATMFATGPYTYCIGRFLLGVAEAGFFPGAAYYLSQWFPPKHRATIFGWFTVAFPVAALIGSPLSAFLLGLHGVGGLAGWQWMFLVEGIPSVILGLILLFTLTETPAEAPWLTAEEKQIVTAAIKAEVREHEVIDIWKSISDHRVVMLAIIEIGWLVGAYGISLWLPLILKAQNLTTSQIGLLLIIPGAVGCVATIGWSRIADLSGRRLNHLSAMLLVAAVGTAAAGLSSSFVVAFIGLTAAVATTHSTRAVFWVVPTRFLSGIALASGLAFINSVGTLGSFVGSSLMGWLKDVSGTYSLGLTVVASFLTVSGLLCLVLKRYVRVD
jgi:MFS transporter, ACS family, tartrate transporter